MTIPPPPLVLNDADCPHTVEIVREGGMIYVHDMDPFGRFQTLIWPAAKAAEIARRLVEVAG